MVLFDDECDLLPGGTGKVRAASFGAGCAWGITADASSSRLAVSPVGPSASRSVSGTTTGARSAAHTAPGGTVAGTNTSAFAARSSGTAASAAAASGRVSPIARSATHTRPPTRNVPSFHTRSGTRVVTVPEAPAADATTAASAGARTAQRRRTAGSSGTAIPSYGQTRYARRSAPAEAVHWTGST
ncbi:hypothetical protein R5W24_001791 [Gemmata sp. JC717]|uniref:hypothetical protein n=1 Tax=Gemmata algarum TaxID=2975278 RepID=UPI0021BB96A4|nr:hypothetical protein [Gemmata algarum]MDY3552704.1 hypothetical protein [Gemmata algarum]